MTSHSRCAKDSASCDTKFCLLREHRVLADVLLKNFVAAYQSLREACAIWAFYRAGSYDGSMLQF